MKDEKAIVSSTIRLSKKSRKTILKTRIRWFFLFGILTILFMIQWLYLTEDRNWFSCMISLLRREEGRDIFLRSTGTRAVVFVMSNRIDEPLCYSVGSAYLSGLPVVVAGYQMPYGGFLSKFDFMEAAIENAKLQPEDVIVIIDSDTLFTGVDIRPFLDSFITQSAATPKKLDALAVRQGRAMAPFLFSGDPGCWAPNIFETANKCRRHFGSLRKQIHHYAAAHPEHELAFPFDSTLQRYVNSGAMIARVWAYKEFLQQNDELRKTQIPPFSIEKGWNCDQSVYTALYLDLVTWEVEHDVFSMSLHERQLKRSPFGVRAGFYGIDYSNMLAGVGTMRMLYAFQVHDEFWVKNLELDESGYPHSHNVTHFRVMGQFVGDIYKRAYATHGERIYTRLAVPKWVAGRRAYGKTYITFTPPLLALHSKRADITNDTMHHTFPIIFHAAGREKGLTKLGKMTYGCVGARWFVPMTNDLKVKKEAMQYLESVPLFLSTNNSIIRDSYHDLCGFPFEGTIEEVKGLSA